MNRARRGVLALGFALLLAGCATRPPHPDAFSFAIIGDTPYGENETVAFLRAIESMNAEPLAFVVHVGDLKAGGNSPCTDAIYADRKRDFERIAHPFLFIPGDNDWVDCRRSSNGGMDPLERLAKLRSLFYGGPFPSGRAIGALRHDEYPEVTRWTRGGVVFATLNVQGSNDNTGFDAASAAEQRRREAVNLAWLAEAGKQALDANAPALVVIVHANPFEKSDQRVYAPLRSALVDAARRLRRPVLFVHGDTHWQRVDQPFTDEDGRAVANLTRLETYGSPWVGWVKVTVDPGVPGLFTFEPRPQ